jgi:phosphoglycolate phosphatase
MSPRLPRGVLFDLDGTLIDHFETLFRCYEHALGRLGLPVPTREQVKRSVGGSMEVTMRKFVPAERLADAAGLWRAHLARTYLDDVSVLPGGRELLTALQARGVRLGVLTNKLGETSRSIMQHLGLAPFLQVVLGADDTPHRKPEPAFSALALARLGTGPEETLLVGDSSFDIAAAHVVGMRCPCVTTGTHTADELQAAGADAVYPNLATLGQGIRLPIIRDTGIAAARFAPTFGDRWKTFPARISRSSSSACCLSGWCSSRSRRSTPAIT